MVRFLPYEAGYLTWVDIFQCTHCRCVSAGHFLTWRIWWSMCCRVDSSLFLYGKVCIPFWIVCPLHIRS